MYATWEKWHMSNISFGQESLFCRGRAVEPVSQLLFQDERIKINLPWYLYGCAYPYNQNFQFCKILCTEPTGSDVGSDICHRSLNSRVDNICKRWTLSTAHCAFKTSLLSSQSWRHLNRIINFWELLCPSCDTLCNTSYTSRTKTCAPQYFSDRLTDSSTLSLLLSLRSMILSIINH